MMHRPQISTLFPYTTLFRSLHRRLRARIGTLGRLHAGGGKERREKVVAGHSFLRSSRAGALSEQWPDRDRKSTRLNSSHVAISYAVFCLKKKIDKRPLTNSV